MFNRNNKIMGNEIVDEIISRLRFCTTSNLSTKELCNVFNLQPIYHPFRKILFRKLIFSQYDPTEDKIHIYIGSLREYFGEDFQSQSIKALYHEIFHFLLLRKREFFSEINVKNRKFDIELSAEIFAEKLLEEVKK